MFDGLEELTGVQTGIFDVLSQYFSDFHSNCICRKFLTKNRMTTVSYLPYSPDLKIFFPCSGIESGLKNSIFKGCYFAKFLKHTE